MITDATLKILQSLISANFDRYAIYDTDLSFICGNCEDFFDAFINSKDDKNILKVNEKTRFFYVTQNDSWMIEVGPYFRTKNNVGCYIYTSNNSTGEMRINMIPGLHINTKSVVLQLQKIRENLNSIVSINEIVTDDDCVHDATEIKLFLTRQYAFVSSCLARSMNLLAAFSDYSSDERNSEDIEAIRFMRAVCNEASSILESKKRNFDVSIPDDYIYIRIKPKIFLVAIANILQNALEYSPSLSDIHVSVEVFKSSCVMAFSNQRKNKQENNENMEMGRYVIKKIVCNDCEGKCDFITDEDMEIVRIEFPKIKKPYKENFKSNISDYIKDRYKPLHLFLDGNIE